MRAPCCEQAQQLFRIERHAGAGRRLSSSVSSTVGQSLVDRIRRARRPSVAVLLAVAERLAAFEIEARVLGERGHVLVVGGAVHGAREERAVLAAHHLVVDGARDARRCRRRSRRARSSRAAIAGRRRASSGRRASRSTCARCASVPGRRRPPCSSSRRDRGELGGEPAIAARDAGVDAHAVEDREELARRRRDARSRRGSARAAARARRCRARIRPACCAAIRRYSRRLALGVGEGVEADREEARRGAARPASSVASRRRVERRAIADLGARRRPASAQPVSIWR